MSTTKRFGLLEWAIEPPKGYGRWWTVRLGGAVVSVQPTLLDALTTCHGCHGAVSCQRCESSVCAMKDGYLAPARVPGSTVAAPAAAGILEPA